MTEQEAAERWPNLTPEQRAVCREAVDALQVEHDQLLERFRKEASVICGTSVVTNVSIRGRSC